MVAVGEDAEAAGLVGVGDSPETDLPVEGETRAAMVGSEEERTSETEGTTEGEGTAEGKGTTEAVVEAEPDEVAEAVVEAEPDEVAEAVVEAEPDEVAEAVVEAEPDGVAEAVGDAEPDEVEAAGASDKEVGGSDGETLGKSGAVAAGVSTAGELGETTKAAESGLPHPVSPEASPMRSSSTVRQASSFFMLDLLTSQVISKYNEL